MLLDLSWLTELSDWSSKRDFLEIDGQFHFYHHGERTFCLGDME